MPLYRGFFKKGPPTPPLEPVDPTRRIVRPDAVIKTRPAPSSGEVATPTPPASPSKPQEPTTVLTPAPTPVPVPVPGPVPASVPPVAPAEVTPTLVSGWLVVTAGPGRGQVLTLGYGINDIGSGPGARIRLNFGDPDIVPDNHAAILYTTRSRRFYLSCSAFREVWLNTAPAVDSTELTGGEMLRLGQTRMRFVRLCGPDFDWRDNEPS